MGDELQLPRRALSVDDFHRMGEVGLLRPEERIELIHGDLITMSPIGGPHLHLVGVIAQLFSVSAGRSAFVSVQGPVSLRPDSEPQPDIALLTADFWRRRAVPTAADVLLLVEVADSSLAYDREVKVPLYARHRIPEVWLFDLQNDQVAVYRDPDGEAYRSVFKPERNAILQPVRCPGVSIALAEVWPADL